MVEDNCRCEICSPGGLGLLQDGSGVGLHGVSGAYGKIDEDYYDYFYAYAGLDKGKKRDKKNQGYNYSDYISIAQGYKEIESIGGRSNKGIKIYPRRKVVSEPKGYVPPYLAGTKGGFVSEEEYTYKGKKYGLEKFFANEPFKKGRVVVPNVRGYAIRKKYIRKKRIVGLVLSLIPFVITAVAALILLV